MANGDFVAVNGGSRVGWFVAGAVVIAAAIGLFLYADGYFDKKDSVELKVGPAKIEIEGQ